jgi:hypothetical protein
MPLLLSPAPANEADEADRLDLHQLQLRAQARDRSEESSDLAWWIQEI